jgi:hypothetical protein
MAGLGVAGLLSEFEAASFALGALAVILSCLLGIVATYCRFRIQLFRAQTDRLVKMRELEIADRQMLLNAQLEREKLLVESSEPEIPFPFPRKAERQVISPPTSEAA